jgi:hypothetical protein
MTRVEILYRYGMPPADAVTFALAGIREVYGVRQFRFDRAARTLRVEYDSTRLDAATVTNLVRGAGLEIVEVLPLSAPAPPAPEPASAS